MFSLALGVLIGVTHLLGYLAYYLAMHSKRRPIKPEPMSWLIWTIGSFVDLFSYSLLSGDLVKDILPFVCSVACVWIFVDQWRRRRWKLEKITREGFSMLSIDASASVIGLMTMSALVANISYQVGTVASFIPILRATDKDPTRERFLPWLLWSTAYGLQVILVAIRWEKWGDLVYPVVGFILSVIMAVITNRRRTP